MELSMQYYDHNRDFGSVYRLFVSPEVGPQLISRPDRNDFQSFEKWFCECIKKSFQDFMVFYQGRDFVGFAYSYQVSLLDGHARFTVAVMPAFQDLGCGALMTAQFLKYLFDRYPLRKLYAHVYGNNERSLVCARMVGTEEAVLKEYHYFGGRFYDMHIFSVSRAVFERRLQKFTKGGKLYEAL